MSRARSLAALVARPRRPPRQAPASGNGVAASVVYVQVFRAPFDWSQPWRQEPVSGASGSGFLIDGGRILTNGHVIADAREVLVRRPDQANPYVATRRGEGRRLRPRGAARRRSGLHARTASAARSARCPRTGTRVNTYGFPLGGQDVSSTAGIVSRIESRGYVHSGADAHLVVQTDAAINPGNSGGPVVQDGRVVGVAFQGFPGADNMGFFIPVPIVRHFLANLEDGRYDGFPDSGLQTASLLSPAYRRERGLPAGRSGVVVDRVAPGGTAEGAVRAGDVLLSVAGSRDRGRRHDPRGRRARDLRARDRHAAGRARGALQRLARRPGARARGARAPHRALRPQPQPLRAWRPTTSCTPGSSSCGSRWSC